VTTSGVQPTWHIMAILSGEFLRDPDYHAALHIYSFGTAVTAAVYTVWCAAVCLGVSWIRFCCALWYQDSLSMYLYTVSPKFAFYNLGAPYSSQNTLNYSVGPWTVMT
jgi:hypothetical protein